MLELIAGIVVFLGAHSFTTLRERRAAVIGRIGPLAYRIVHSLVSLAGLVLIVRGYGHYRASGYIPVWTPPLWLSHVTILLMWFAFVSLAAMGKRPGRIRGWLRHPMLVAIKIWALAHLLANGDLGSMVLFGSFLAWAVYDRIAVKRRGDDGAPRVPRFTRADAMVLAIGTVAYVAMIFLHPVLIGVPVLMR
ncbi:MAG: NnrU family protein [Acetobacteraceae bacterium]